MTESIDFKVCPYCGNWVRGRAYRCRHCKRWIIRPVNPPITWKVGPAIISGVGTGIVDKDYICPKCQGRSPKGSSQCARCKKFRYYSTPDTGIPGHVVFWDKLKNLPELINQKAPECPWCAEVFWSDEQPEVCPSCNVRLSE